MPEIVTVLDKPYIELRVRSSFIRKYDLQRYLGTPLPSKAPDNHVLVNLSNETVTYPFHFPPHEITDYPVSYLQTFLEILPHRFLDKHKIPPYVMDELLLLAYSIPHKDERDYQNRKLNLTRERARFVISLLKVPLRKISKATVLKYITEDKLLGYATVASSGSEEIPLINRAFDLNSIDDDLWTRISGLIERDLNISACLEGDSYITISADIQLNATSVGSVADFHESLRDDILRTLLNDFAKEQKENDTKLYHALLAEPTRDIGKLLRMLGVYDRDGYYKWLRSTALIIGTYLHDEGIAAFNKSGTLSGRQLQIIYYYFLVLGLLKQDRKLHHHPDIDSLNGALEQYRAKKAENARFDVRFLRDNLTNL
jgi:hypothetical protein